MTTGNQPVLSVCFTLSLFLETQYNLCNECMHVLLVKMHVFFKCLSLLFSYFHNNPVNNIKLNQFLLGVFLRPSAQLQPFCITISKFRCDFLQWKAFLKICTLCVPMISHMPANQFNTLTLFRLAETITPVSATKIRSWDNSLKYNPEQRYPFCFLVCRLAPWV